LPDHEGFGLVAQLQTPGALVASWRDEPIHPYGKPFHPSTLQGKWQLQLQNICSNPTARQRQTAAEKGSWPKGSKPRASPAQVAVLTL
jgi:hypothetical protein